MRLFPVVAAVVLSCSSAHVVTGRASAQGGYVGLRKITAVDPITKGPLEGLLFYPTATAPGEGVALGPYHVRGTFQAPPQGNGWPLVVLSHGHGGSMLGHHDLSEALAEHGFAVLAVEHGGDSYRDQSGFGSDRVLLGRPAQASALLDAALAAPGLGDRINPARIGAMGFSAGGYTALLLAGARPDFKLLAPYCQRHPADPEFCGEPLRHLLDHAPQTEDPRIRAVFAMAPLAIFFAPADVSRVRAPVFLVEATHDHVLLPEENAEPLRRALPNLSGFRAVDADHYVFLAPCPPAMAQRAPELCTDAPGVDRNAVHRELVQEVTEFFARTLPGAL